MEELHAAIVAHLRRQRSEMPRRADPGTVRVREAAIYARVAPTTQGGATVLEAQVAVCRALAETRGDTVALVYRELADGDTLERPRLADLRAFIARGWIATVLVTTLDRLTADPVLLGALRAEWGVLGVAIIAVMGGA